MEDISRFNDKLKSFHSAYGSSLWSMIDDYMQIISSANYNAFMQAKEEQDMCETILKIFEPEINEAVNNKISKELKKADEDKKQALAKADAAEAGKKQALAKADAAEADKKQSLLDAAKKLIRAGVSDDILYNCIDHDIVNLAKQ